MAQHNQNEKNTDRFVQFRDVETENQKNSVIIYNESDQESFSDTTAVQIFNKRSRNNRKHAEKFEATNKKSNGKKTKTVWAYCVSNEVDFQLLASSLKSETNNIDLKIENSHSEVLSCTVFNERKTLFIFKYGCMVLWDFANEQRAKVLDWVKRYLIKEIKREDMEFDDMEYTYSNFGKITADMIHLNSNELFEKLAYSYAFAQSTKLSVFESVVDSTIETNKKYPEGLAKTGSIKLNRHEICRKIGELFVNRFFINLQTDILDTPDILWDNDDYADQYESCRRYLEIPKRVTILNQRLDIIKDLFDMLNNELVIQHGYNLEWIVITLICIEVIIDVVWNIILKRFTPS